MKKIVLWSGSAILIIVVFSFALMKYYFRNGNISGDVYLTMQSGDIKKVAGVEVTLYKTDSPAEILKEIAKLKLDSVMPMKAAAEEFSDALKYESDKVADLIKWGSGGSDFYKSLVDKSRAMTEEKKLKLKALIEEHNAKVNGILSPLSYKKVRTDVNGHYEFINVPYSKYIVFSNYKIIEEYAEWLYPVEIKNKENKHDLTNNNLNKETAFFNITF